MLLLKKIPDSMRAKVKKLFDNNIIQIWLLTSGAKREIMNNPDYYKNLTERFPKNIPSPFVEQIDMVFIEKLFISPNQDVRRTFPDDLMFRKEDVLQKLKNVLLAYSRRNLTIGYCQGFNFIVGRLVKIYSEEVI